ncbi:pilus assembly protein TadG-related protein [Inquilinus limosus]|nr:pilus assembly protein TadG-related protein [Inquilinus limosus]
MIGRLIRRGSGDGGAIAPFAALMLVPLIGTAALATDVGLWYAQQRHLQVATDVSALSAALKISDATTIAGNLLKANGFETSSLTSAVPGVYCPEGAKPADRFKLGLTACEAGDPAPDEYSAVQVTAHATVPGVLSRSLLQTGDGQMGQGGSPNKEGIYPISTRSTAARIDEAGLQAGTGLLTLDTTQSPLLNAVLGGVLGTKINLTAVHYNGLVNTDIDALTFLDALATHVGASVGTYDGLLDSNVKVGQILQAAIDVLHKQGNIAGLDLDALNALLALQSQIAGNPDLALGKLLDLGLWKTQEVGSSTKPSALQAGLNLYQLVTLSAQVANSQNFISIPSLTLGLPGVASVEVAATVIEKPQRPPFAFGPKGISVHTAQVRTQIKLQLLDLFGLLGQGIQLPVYIEAASGDATLGPITCDPDVRVEVDATVHAAAAYIGTLPMGLMTNFSHKINYQTDIQPAPLIDIKVLLLGLVHIDGRAKLELLEGHKTMVFDKQDIDDQVAQQVWGGGAVDNLLGSLGIDPVTGKPNLELKACVLSLGNICLLPVDLSVVSSTVTALNQLLAPVIKGVLDPLVDNLLAALGVRIGVMDVVVTGVRCGVPVLIE